VKLSFPKNRAHLWDLYILRLAARCVVFLLTLVLCFTRGDLLDLMRPSLLLALLWLGLMLEMLQRFLPQPLVTIGCQRQFAHNFRPTSQPPDQTAVAEARQAADRGALKVAVIWLFCNAIIWMLYFRHLLQTRHLLLISMFYFVSDLICVLFWCPFQSLLMHNRCCSICRIFNWDAMMVYMPLVIVKSFFSWSLTGVAVLLLVLWECRWRKYPGRFLEACNASLGCGNCMEHLCRFKRLPRL